MRGGRLRTVLAFGYWVLPNICQYWVVLGTGQYFSGLQYPIPILPNEFQVEQCTNFLNKNWQETI